MRIIHQASDKFLKQSLADPRVAKEFFTNHLPIEIKELIDLGTLSAQPKSFIDEAYKAVEADILYQVDLLNQTSSAYVYLLCEGQSQIDEKMAFRLLVYMIRIMEMHLKKHPKSPLPLIYPLVVYTGKKPWNAPLDIFSLFGEHQEIARKTFLSAYQLVDVQRLSDDELKKHFWSGIVEFALKYRQVQDFARFLDTLLPWLRDLEKQDGTPLAKIVLRYVIDAIEANNEELFLKKAEIYLSNELKGEMMTLAQRFEERGMEKGMEKGIEKGIEQVAIRLLKKKENIDFVAEATGLTREKIKLLQQKIQ